jgi:hypothetical protein
MTSTLPASSRSFRGSRPRAAAQQRPSGRSHSTRTDRSTITSPTLTGSRTQISPGIHGDEQHPNHHNHSPPRRLTQIPVQISDSRFVEFGSVSGCVLCSLPARRFVPSSRLGLPPSGGGRLLFATAAALEPLDDGATGAALFGALLKEATGGRVAYPAAFACASLPSHGLKVLEPSCSFNFPVRPPRHPALLAWNGPSQR